MAIFPSLKVKSPKQSNFDLSRKVRTTMAPGVLTPILCEPVIAGDQVKIAIESLMKTYAALVPIMGTFKLETSVWFAPLSLYIPRLKSNSALTPTNTSKLPDVNFPYFRLPSSAATSIVDYSNNFVAPDSLLRYLGLPYRFVDKTAPVEELPGIKTLGRKFNGVPLLMYVDIFRNYYANRQEANYPVITDGLQSTWNVLNNLDNEFERLQNGQYLGNLPLIQSHITPFSRRMGGLLTRCYLPDMKNVILSSTMANVVANATSVSTSGGSFTIDQFNLAQKLYKVYTLSQLAGNRFSEWVRAQYAVQPKTLSDRPTFIGSTSTEIAFEDVVQTGGGDMSNPDSETGYLGDLAGRGRAYMDGKYHRFTADQPGYVMVLASIVPRVDYYQFVHRFLLDTQLSDLFVNKLNGLGLQDVLVSDLFASSLLDSTDPSSAWNSGTDPFKVSLGKQPAWLHLMSAVNEVFGDFCTDALRGWTLSRPMTSGDSSGEPVSDVNPSAYIDPSLWNYAFTDTSPLAQNFMAQYAVQMFKRSNLSKRLMPNF